VVNLMTKSKRKGSEKVEFSLGYTLTEENSGQLIVPEGAQITYGEPGIIYVVEPGKNIPLFIKPPSINKKKMTTTIEFDEAEGPERCHVRQILIKISKSSQMPLRS
jgi:hypothetical protein